MDRSELLQALSLGTLVIVLALALVAYLRFIRKSQNRHPLAGKHEDNIAQRLDESHDAHPGEPPLR